MWNNFISGSSKLMMRIWNYGQYYLKFTMFVAITLIVCLIEIPIMILRTRDVMNGFMFTQTLKYMLKIIGMKVTIRNGEILAKDRGAVVILNHQSVLDCIVLYNVWYYAYKMVMVQKKELIYLLPFWLIGYFSKSIYIDRKKPADAYSTIKNSSESLFRDKIKVSLFPEGTRNKNQDRLQAFKKGAFSLAIDYQVPILPVVISPYYFLDSEKRIFNNGNVIAQCLQEVSTEGLTSDNVTELRDKVQSIMEHAYKELTEEMLRTLPSEHSLKTR